MGLLTRLAIFLPSWKRSSGSNRKSFSASGEFSRNCNVSRPFTKAETRTEYREVPPLDLSRLHFQNTEPMEDPAAVSAQVASLTMDMVEVLDRLEALEKRRPLND